MMRRRWRSPYGNECSAARSVVRLRGILRRLESSKMVLGGSIEKVVGAMSHSSSILRFVTDDSTQANESIASVLQRLCVFLEQDMLFGSPEPLDHTDLPITNIFEDRKETLSECYSAFE
jgi:hypothetical protein